MLTIRLVTLTDMKLKIYFFFFVLAFFSTFSGSWATHIRAGEIIAERISVQTLTYRITVVGYTDTFCHHTYLSGSWKLQDSIFGIQSK
jgi:hypothetical protein